jgi:transcriptional regulator with XRE-family HTH domain
MKTDTEIIKAFGKSIRRERLSKRFKQSELAEKAGCSVRFILSIENNKESKKDSKIEGYKSQIKHLPSIEMIYRLSVALECNMTDLISDLKLPYGSDKKKYSHLIELHREGFKYRTGHINSDVIKSTRERLYLTQEELAKDIGCSRRLLQKIEYATKFHEAKPEEEQNDEENSELKQEEVQNEDKSIKMKHYPPIEIMIALSKRLVIPIDELLPFVPFLTTDIQEDISDWGPSLDDFF